MPKFETNESGTPFDGPRQKFATQMDADLLRQLREYAKSEGRQIQSVLEEAVINLLKNRQGYKMRPDVMSAYQESLDRYSDLYEALAK
jgi:hypothetical protein